MLRYDLTDEPPVRPEKLRFSILSAQEIEQMSVVEVNVTTLYYRGLPASGGLLDSLMGSVDRRHLCASCMRCARTCEGHCGHIKLAFPMFHYGFIDATLKTLRTLCFACSRVCATEEEAATARALPNNARLQSLHAQLRGRKTCPHCSCPRPSYARSSYGIDVEWPSDTAWESDEERTFCTNPFTAREALSMLRHMRPEDIELLGFSVELSHPANMILQNLLVPPPCSRPAIYSSEGSRSRGQNDLTIRLLEILRRSQEVQVAMGPEVHWRDADVTPTVLTSLHHLQYEIFVLVNNTARIPRPPGMGRSSGGQNAKSISTRLRGKEGRVRGNLMGKRVDFSARCVITPDAYFECDRVGVPYSIAKTLTIPEVVNATNMMTLAERVRNGNTNMKGAAYVITNDGSVTDLAQCKQRKDIVLHPGDVVERFLDDDDFVVFNRQPSLHMHGMQCHRVRLMPGNTFRLNLVVAAPYNADFDGDEMNVHVPQSKAAAAECAALMSVTQNCIGAQANRPVMGIVQDSLLGLHMLTQADVLFDHAHACRIVGVTCHIEKRLPSRPALTIAAARGTGERPLRLWSGRQLFSRLLPAGLYVEPNRLADLEDPARESVVVVRDGELLHGELRKSHVGTSAGGIVDVMCRDFGNVMTMRFMADAQRMTHAFLLQCGHHVGIDDVLLTAEGHASVTERVETASRLCEEIQREMIEAPKETVTIGERGILRLLSKMLMQAGGIVNEHMGRKNAIRRMVNAGSKGSFINLSQICATLGQQSLEGGRIESERKTRTLPSFSTHDTSLASRGMVFNSFALGLSPTELFYHAIGGREGLVDTAVKTSQTGYLQRRMNKSMEDHVVYHDGTVRNSLLDIISFRWGSDGMHPARLERVRLDVLVAAEADLRKTFTGRECEDLIRRRRRVMRVKTSVLMGEVDLRVLLPFHCTRMRQRIERLRKGGAGGRTEDLLTEDVASERMWALVNEQESDAVAIGLVDVLAWSRVRGLRSDDHADVVEDVRVRIARAGATCGESVGCIAAQSVGEPATQVRSTQQHAPRSTPLGVNVPLVCAQMTLNTFHAAGVGMKNVTLGIPRLKELLDASKQQKTPCTSIRFAGRLSTSRAFADYVASTFPLTRLSDVVRECEILHEPDLTFTSIAEDKWMVHVDATLGGQPSDAVSYSDYVVRLTLNQEVVKTRHLSPPMIKQSVINRLGTRAWILCSETNDLDWILRIRFANTSDMIEHGGMVPEQEAVLVHRAMNVLLETVAISGHPCVTSADSVEVQRYDLDGSHDTEYNVHAYGSALSDCVACDGFDYARCTSNDIWEVFEHLGIEATAHVFYDQLAAVVSFDGTYVDERHLVLIVDTVLRGGAIMPLNRHGINRTESMPLMRCSFEETVDVLSNAAMFAEEENAKGVTTSIMLGQLSEFGTGRVDVQLRKRNVVTQPFRTRVLRSTCRSHTRELPAETVEYVCERVRHRPTLGDQIEEIADTARPRVRFRPSSPELEDF